MDVMVLMKPAQLARKVLAAPRGAVPYPLLRENTLVLSDVLVLGRRPGGRLELQARVGDVYPNQVNTPTQCHAQSKQLKLPAHVGVDHLDVPIHHNAL